MPLNIKPGVHLQRIPSRDFFQAGTYAGVQKPVRTFNIGMPSPVQIIPTPQQLVALIDQGQVTSITVDPANNTAPYRVKVLDGLGGTRTLLFYQTEQYTPPDWKLQLAAALNRQQLTIMAKIPPKTVIQKGLKTGLFVGLTSLLFFPVFGPLYPYRRLKPPGLTSWLPFLKKKKMEKKVSLKDIGGLGDEVRMLQRRLLLHIQAAQKAKTIAEKLEILNLIPKGILFTGPPGTGKTQIARAIAHSADAKFFLINASDIEGPLVGSGPERLERVFADARKHCLDRNGNIRSLAVIFIDELDAIGKKRSGESRQYEMQTLNKLLALMDGFEKEPYITVMASTNQPELLDKALLRPGRFTLQLPIRPPMDVLGRKEILDIHLSKNKFLMQNLDPQLRRDFETFKMALAKQMPRGITGAEIEELVKEIHNVALERWHDKPQSSRRILSDDFYTALEHLVLGIPKLSVRYTAEEIRRFSRHEWGHALVGKATGIPVQAITVVPRQFKDGTALGVVALGQKKNELIPMTRAELENDIAMTLAGRASEILHYGERELSAGASSDLQQVHHLVMAGITQWGLYPNQFGLGVFPPYNSPFGNTISDKQMAKAEEAAHHIVKTIDRAVHAFLGAIDKTKFHELCETLEHERTINKPEKIDALLATKGLGNLEEVWEKIAMPIIREIK